MIIHMTMTPLLVLIVALFINLWATYRAQSVGGREGLPYLALGAGAMVIAGCVGVVLEPGYLRFAWAVLAIAWAIRLVWLGVKARREDSSGAAPHP
jgi:uncharacterized membrane protein YfcA